MQLEGLLLEKDQVQDQEVAAVVETAKMPRKMKKQRKKKNQTPSEKLQY